MPLSRDIGDLEPLFQAGGHHREVARSATANMIEPLEDEDRVRCGIARYQGIPDLLTGIAGVGLGIQRVVDPNLGSVLPVE